MRALTIALRTLVREWKSGELGVLVLAITVAVAALTGVGFLVDRISAAVDAQAGEVLAADLRLESARPIDEKSVNEATQRGIKIARGNFDEIVHFVQRRTMRRFHLDAVNRSAEIVG